MLHSRPASPNSFITHPLYALPNTITMQDDLYRSAFGLSKQQQPGGNNSDHSRHPSNGSSHSSFSLGASTALSTPNDSPPLDFLNSPAAGGIAKLGRGGGRLGLAHEQTGPIRRMHPSRQDASASPYPSQPPLRSNSFSGSDSHRSSSSEAEDIGALFPQYGNQQLGGQGQLGGQQGGHSHHEYAQAQAQAAMYAHTNRSANALALGQIDPSANPAASFQRMSINTNNSDQALEQLAANVRAATTTSASDRAKHIFVQAWLNANYAPYQDGNVPRQGLYNSYRRVCDEYRIPHVNTATLGKAIRLCFPAIKTRRLGVRGNSKYHYCGIRPSTASEAEWLQDFVNRTNNTRTAGNNSSGARPTSQSGRSSSANDDSPDDDDDEDGGNESSHSHLSSSHGHGGHHGGMTSSGLPHLSLSRGPGGSGGGNGRRSPVYFSMTDDKTPTVGGFNAAQAQAIHGGHHPHGSGSGGPSYTSLRRRAADGIVASNVSAYNTRGSSGASTSASGMVGTLRPGQSVRTLRGFPDVEEAIGGGQGPPLPSSDPTSSLLVPSSDPSDSTSASASSTPSLSSSTSTSASTTSPPSSSGTNTGASTSAFATTAREVWRWFEDHLDLLIEAIRAFRFDTYEVQVRQFWGGLSGEHKEIVHAPAVAGLMAKADALVYDEILEILRSQLLVSIPPHVLTGLRQLADKMEKLLLGALEGYGTTFVEPKVELGARFGHLVLRFLDIYQVTQALSSVMANPKQLQDMARSWRDVDFESVRNQAALVCNCRHEDLHALLEVEFVAVLDGLMGSEEPVRDVIQWADAVCERLIGVHTAGAVAHAQQQPGAEERVTMSSRSLLIRWGYVTSQIMRDLTIRSDPAFGAFQILKLFMDDWIALNVLRNVALSTNSVAASVEPTMHNQFLALSPGGSQFAPQHQQHPSQSHHSHNSGHQHPTHINTSNGGHNMHQHSAMMAHTPTTASMIAAMGDPFGTSSLLGGAGSTSMGASNSSGGTFAFEPLSFGSHMDSGVGMVGSGAFDFGGHGLSMDVGGHSHQGPSGHGDDSEMSEPEQGDDGLVKVEGTA